MRMCLCVILWRHDTHTHTCIHMHTCKIASIYVYIIIVYLTFPFSPPPPPHSHPPPFTHAQTHAYLRDYTAREQYREWEQTTERNEYDQFLRRNYFSVPSDPHEEEAPILHENRGREEGKEGDSETSAWGGEGEEEVEEDGERL